MILNDLHVAAEEDQDFDFFLRVGRGGERRGVEEVVLALVESGDALEAADCRGWARHARQE